jgi:hypothetical protein
MNAQLDEFRVTGIMKIEGAFSDSDAARMRDVLWNELRKRYEIERADATTWNRHEPWGLRTTKKSSAFTPICGEPVAEVLDALFGADGWQRPKHYGNVLVTMPAPGEWRVPDKIWHSDFQPTLARDRLSVVKLWALFDDVDPGGGGTPQLAGSHRAFARYLDQSDERDYKKAKFGFLRSDPWLRELARDDGEPGRNERLMTEGTCIDGIELRVVECAGKSGDVFVTHPWVFHTIAANTSSRPRLMRSVQIAAVAA